MRVVWITHNYPRHSGDVAGAFLHPLARALRGRGVDVRVVAPSDAGKGGREELDGVPVRRVRYGAPRRESLAYRGTMADALRTPAGWAALFRLRSALRTGALAELEGGDAGNSVLHAHWWIPGGIAAPRTAPLVLTSHGTDVQLLDRVPLSAILARPVFRRARVVTAVSRTLAEIIQRRVQVTVGSDAVQPMPVVDVPRPETDRGGGLVVIGRLSAQKRVHLVIESIGRLRAADVSTTLTIVGDGPERVALERRAAALGVADAVRFIGAVPPAAIPQYLGNATCCVMPARHEGFGLVAAEALMQGVPVVGCSDGGGLLEVVPRDGGGRIAAPDADSIAAAVRALLASPAAYGDARAAGEQWRTRLSAEFVAARCLDWYARALDA